MQPMDLLHAEAILVLKSDQTDAMWVEKFACKKASGEPKVLVTIPSTDLVSALRLAQLMNTRSGLKNPAEGLLILLIEDVCQHGFIAIANRAFKLFDTEYFVYCAQDAFPGRNWLKRALTAMEVKQKSLLAFNDGKWFGLLAGFGLVRRSWALGNYESQNLFFEGYKSHYADTELTLLALSQSQHIYDANCVLLEVDWDKDSKPTTQADKLLFAQRKLSKFDNRVVQQELLGLFS